MSTFIEDFYYGNIEPQELNSEITPKLKKKLSILVWLLRTIMMLLCFLKKELKIAFFYNFSKNIFSSTNSYLTLSQLLDFIGNHNHAFFVAINFYGAERLI